MNDQRENGNNINNNNNSQEFNNTNHHSSIIESLPAAHEQPVANAKPFLETLPPSKDRPNHLTEFYLEFDPSNHPKKTSDFHKLVKQFVEAYRRDELKEEPRFFKKVWLTRKMEIEVLEEELNSGLSSTYFNDIRLFGLCQKIAIQKRPLLFGRSDLPAKLKDALADIATGKLHANLTAPASQQQLEASLVATQQKLEEIKKRNEALEKENKKLTKEVQSKEDMLHIMYDKYEQKLAQKELAGAKEREEWNAKWAKEKEEADVKRAQEKQEEEVKRAREKKEDEEKRIKEKQEMQLKWAKEKQKSEAKWVQKEQAWNKEKEEMKQTWVKEKQAMQQATQELEMKFDQKLTEQAQAFAREKDELEMRWEKDRLKEMEQEEEKRLKEKQELEAKLVKEKQAWDAKWKQGEQVWEKEKQGMELKLARQDKDIQELKDTIKEMKSTIQELQSTNAEYIRLSVASEKKADDYEKKAKLWDKYGIAKNYGVGFFDQSSSKKEETPEYLSCPISQELMTDPVVASDGHTYERENIERWIKTNEKANKTPLSPMTNKPLTKVLVPNTNLINVINDYLTKANERNAQEQTFSDNNNDTVSIPATSVSNAGM